MPCAEEAQTARFIEDSLRSQRCAREPPTRSSDLTEARPEISEREAGRGHRSSESPRFEIASMTDLLKTIAGGTLP